MTNDARYPPGSTPPKSLGKIRAVLKAIMNANAPPEPGPLERGLGKFDWIAVESFREWPAGYLETLRQNGIPTRVRRSKNQCIVFVRYPELGAARALLGYGAEAPTRQRPAARPDPAQAAIQMAAILGSGLGLLAGAVCGIAVSLATGARTNETPYPATLMAAGAVLGLTLGPLVHIYRRNW